MATQMQLRGGTTAENLLFTGAQREITVDTDKHSVIVHDGVTAGGYPMATSPQVTNGTFYFNDNVAGGSAANAYILVPKANTNTPTMYTDGLQLGFTTANPNTGPATASFQGFGVKSMKYRGGADPAAGDINGRVYLIFDSGNDWFEIQRKVVTPPPQLFNVVASVASNALTLGILPQIIDFRSNTPGSGASTSRTIVSQVNLTIPSGATLGTTNGVAANLVLLAIDIGGGVVEAAVTNLASGFKLDESTPINTTAISAGATSGTAFYSTTARASVSYRVIAVINIVESSAGVWSTAPTRVQGMGGASYSMLNINLQRWQDLTASRDPGTTYTNSTGAPITVIATFTQTTSASSNGVVVVGGVTITSYTFNGATNLPRNLTFVVPDGQTYSVSGTVTKNNWAELR